jgi:hypothetical protein
MELMMQQHQPLGGELHQYIQFVQQMLQGIRLHSEQGPIRRQYCFYRQLRLLRG